MGGLQHNYLLVLMGVAFVELQQRTGAWLSYMCMLRGALQHGSWSWAEPLGGFPAQAAHQGPLLDLCQQADPHRKLRAGWQATLLLVSEEQRKSNGLGKQIETP